MTIKINLEQATGRKGEQMERNCYTPKYRFEVEWFNVWKDPYSGLIREERMYDNMVFAFDELDACCRMADKWPEGYGFEARRLCQ